FHCTLAMGDDNELSCRAHIPHHLGKTINVRLIERCIDFVENAERTRLVSKQRNQQRKRCQRLFSTREQQHILKLLPGRLRNDFYSGIYFFGAFEQSKFAVSSAEETDEGLLEARVDGLKGFLELSAADGIDFVDRLGRVANGIEQVLPLSAQKFE